MSLPARRVAGEPQRNLRVPHMAKSNLTDRTLAALAKAGRQEDHYDLGIPGLLARPKASGGVSWGFRYSLAGKKRRLTIGDWPAVTLAEARRKALGHRKALADGRDPWSEAKQAAAAETVAEAVEEYVESHLRPRLKAWELPAKTLRTKLVPALGHKRVCDVTRAEVRAEALKLAKTAPVYANRFLGHMVAFFNWTIRNDVGGMGERPNPAALVDKPGGPETPKTRALTTEEIAALWPVLVRLGAPFGTAARLILATGLRPGEVCGIDAAEVDIVRGRWTIPASRMKNGREHTVPLVGIAREIVQDLLDKNAAGLLLTARRGRPLTTENLWHGLQRALVRAGVASASAHDLRRTALSHMARIGIDPLHIGHVASHTSVTASTITTSVYVRHDYVPEKTAALAAWDHELCRIVGASQEQSNVIELPGRRSAHS